MIPISIIELDYRFIQFLTGVGYFDYERVREFHTLIDRPAMTKIYPFLSHILILGGIAVHMETSYWDKILPLIILAT